MRLARQTLRNVKLKRPGLSSQESLRPLPFQTCPSTAHWLLLGAGRSRRHFWTSSLPSPGGDSDPILAELLHVAEKPPRSSFESLRNADNSLVQAADRYHKWRFLLANPARLAIESDFRRQGPAKNWRRRLLVDEDENMGDIALWSCLLDYQMRIKGPAGVTHVWEALWGRKALYTTEGPLAEMFWRVILEGALASDKPNFLIGVWMYSEWMYDLHGVKWPNLYTTIIPHMLRARRHREVMQWQLRLTPNFYPGPTAFANIMKQFVSDRALYKPNVIKSLYLANCDHTIYNTVVSHLYDVGESLLARKWRRICLQHDDLPVEPVPPGVKEFLRFLRGYHRQHDKEKLVPEETAIQLPLSFQETKPAVHKLSREYMNIVYGQTFGINVKNYDDRLGAKWFATRWISLDLAISTVATLGVPNIGPLSVQSIGLRVRSAEALADRMAQLQEQGVGIGESNYTQLLVYLIKQKDDELLRDLLRSDIHPDVFEDMGLQTRMTESASNRSDWRTLRLLLVSRLVLFEQSARAMVDRLLEIRFEDRDLNGVLRVLQDMKSRNIPLLYHRVNWIFDNLFSDYRDRVTGITGLPIQLSRFYLAVFRQLRAMDAPPPTSCWRLLIINMARNGWFGEMEKLCHDLIDVYSSSSLSRPGFMHVSYKDVPRVAKGPLWRFHKTQGIYVPHDLRGDYGNHPLRLLFNEKAMAAMVEHAFIAHPGQGFRGGHGARPHGRQSQVSQIQMVIGLLGAAHKRTLCIHVPSLESIVTNCLVALYHPAKPSNSRQSVMRAANTLTLKEMKMLIDEAWGDKLLPKLAELRKIIKKHDPNAMFAADGDLEPTEANISDSPSGATREEASVQ